MAVKQASKVAGIKEVCTYIRQTYATHLLEDGLDIITLKDPLEHQNIELCPNPIFMWFYFTR
jgi:site-specific recombinase XerD